jgi:hypothetical protein
VSHGHVDVVLLSLTRHPHTSPELVTKNALTFFHWSARHGTSTARGLLAVEVRKREEAQP